MKRRTNQLVGDEIAREVHSDRRGKRIDRIMHGRMDEWPVGRYTVNGSATAVNRFKRAFS